MSFNQITILGHCGRDAELRMTPQGKSVASVSVAAGSKDKSTWFKLVAWDVSSEWLAKAKKGDKIFACGSLQAKPYQTKSGNQGTDLIVTVSSLRLLAKHDEENPFTNETAQAPYDDEVPF